MSVDNFFSKKLIFIISGACLMVLTAFLTVVFICEELPEKQIFVFPPISDKTEKIEKFSSEKDFKDYLQKGEAEVRTGFWGDRERPMLSEPMGMKIKEETAFAPAPAERVSETTVQVAGIDEPDIVKTDGKKIYFSPEESYYHPRIRREGSHDYLLRRSLKIIKAFPPADLEIEGKIDRRGDLLLNQDTLIVFSGQEIFGYDVSDPKSPEKKWDIELGSETALVGIRLYKNKIYLVSQNRINQSRPCPIEPLRIKGESVSVKCLEIYHPFTPIPVDVTFVGMILDPLSGEIEKKISFVGSSSSSIIYMSGEAIYVTYSYYESMSKFFFNFLSENQDLISSEILEKIRKLENYDLSQSTKLMEFQTIFENYLNFLDDDERLRIENELFNRTENYFKIHQRDLEKTGIVKIGLDNFEIAASGNVSGYPLNQFALDEYQNNLRIAVTIGERWAGPYISGFNIFRESANDVYVLDKDLKILGSVQDLGLTEKIYSARFIEDKGYLVTFRQTDPFYILDLSDAQNPELKGELKIPGYSSYLHPLTKDKILGIGKEDQRVKISLFDVSSPTEPKEADKYLLDEFWSDVLSTHHAFLLDEKHSIFFLPGSKGGYVFSYKDDKLKLVKTISQISARRAIYLNDYLYIIGDDKISVLSELDWEKVNELSLD